MSFFNSEQSFEDIFYSYLNNVSVKGELFSYDDEFLEDDDTLIVWYIEHVIGWAGDLWEKILEWSMK